MVRGSFLIIPCTIILLISYGFPLPMDMNVDIMTVIKHILQQLEEVKEEVKSLRKDVDDLKPKGFKWPEGSYGIVSYGSCPAGWYEFTHCQDTEDESNNDHTEQFKPSFPGCEASSFTLRYCFKGSEIVSRKGGFGSKNGVVAYVVKNVGSNCTDFGEEGGKIHIDNEDNQNANRFGNNGLNGKKFEKYNPGKWFFSDLHNTNLEFCKIGGSGGNGTDEEYIKVGRFDEKFGLFVTPGQRCPILQSPYGLLHGSAQNFRLDDEDNNYNDQFWGHPPVIRDVPAPGGSLWCVCQYDPNKGA